MRAILGRTRAETFDPDGFYATGDLGRLDAAGFLWYEGRRDDMFKVSGATVYPTEVEAALRAIDGVRQAHVANVAEEVGASGVVGALVVSDLSVDDLAAGAKARLSSFKVPTCWLVTSSADEVPLNATSKVDLAALRDRLRSAGVPSQRPTSAPSRRL
jgi:acyl-CoA synthetase (AMP-forming)/AMP-acid ligase II